MSRDYNYRYYEQQSIEAFVTADETGNNDRAQLFLLDSIARSLACLADAYAISKGVTEPKKMDIELGLAGEDDS